MQKNHHKHPLSPTEFRPSLSHFNHTHNYLLHSRSCGKQIPRIWLYRSHFRFLFSSRHLELAILAPYSQNPTIPTRPRPQPRRDPWPRPCNWTLGISERPIPHRIPCALAAVPGYRDQAASPFKESSTGACSTLRCGVLRGSRAKLISSHLVTGTRLFLLSCAPLLVPPSPSPPYADALACISCLSSGCAFCCRIDYRWLCYTTLHIAQTAKTSETGRLHCTGKTRSARRVVCVCVCFPGFSLCPLFL